MKMEELQSQYVLRGYPVQARTNKEIASEAIRHFIFLHGYGISLKNIEKIIDVLAVEFDISIHIENNSKWDKTHSYLKRGESIPSQRKIVLPKRVFDGVKRGREKDLEVLFHEIGHVTLKHEPVYMKSEGYILSALDDAEEQADYFANIMLQLFEVDIQPQQLRLF